MNLRTQMLLQGNLRFQRGRFEHERETFARLLEGQTPRALFIGCSDSRVVPNFILDAGPGELFVVRNIGAIVCRPDDPASASLGAAIDYAVNALAVPDVIVCGHDLCGGLQAIVDDARGARGTHLEQWLRHGSTDALGNDLLDHIEGLDLSTIVERFVAIQLERLRSYPTITTALARGRVALHGVVYDPRSGQLRALASDGRFRTARAEPVERLSLPPALLDGVADTQPRAAGERTSAV